MEVQDLLMAVEWFASPVFADLGKETVLNGIPLGSACRWRITELAKSDVGECGVTMLQRATAG